MLREIILLDTSSSARRDKCVTYHSYLHDNRTHTADRLLSSYVYDCLWRAYECITLKVSKINGLTCH